MQNKFHFDTITKAIRLIKKNQFNQPYLNEVTNHVENTMIRENNKGICTFSI